MKKKKGNRMSPAAKVSLNQWLLTVVVSIASIWSTFQLMQYKIDALETKTKNIVVEIDGIEKNKDSIINVNHNVDMLSQYVKTSQDQNTKQYKELSTTLKDIRAKL